MMMQPAIGTDAHPAAEQAWMQERMQVQDIAFAEMISVLREIGKEVYRSRDLLDGMSENGIGTYALTQSVQKTTWTN